ncbi:MAG: hypothetical protein EWV40_07640 [Microcystis flos-aquae Mf_WU_F_19750830_S460]|uniref:Uncharacterized protein n=1 Tax=Microcystis flos-aquae Mf_WU_F_19750830_S460 TaxID=2486237 RepID=A0A552LUE1_9CHRO|nr:MAG: hypothetical protein EWV40_07640 [Microcystis flos-aquae Mf_WU_F_19750830_S460]
MLPSKNFLSTNYVNAVLPPVNRHFHTKSVEYRLHIRTGTHAKEGINNQFLITGFSIVKY